MKTDTQIMNEIAIKTGYLKELSKEQSEAQKKLLLEMYKDISKLCDEHGLVYMMGGGTCLGTVRHQGYIPWDDDLDIMLPRDSYEKLIVLLSNNLLGDKYEYDTPNKEKDCKNPFLKVYRKNTLDIEITSETVPGPKGLYIDVFPMDYAPNNIIMRRIKGAVSDFLQSVCSCVLYTEYPSKRYKEFMMQTQEGRKRYMQRMFLGHLFGIISHRKWVWWFDRLNAKSKRSNYLTIPTGRKHYIGETQLADVFFPVQKGVFEGIEVNIPSNYDAYLTSLYGNYMQVPPVEKRERHFVYKFSLNTNKK